MPPRRWTTVHRRADGPCLMVSACNGGQNWRWAALTDQEWTCLACDVTALSVVAEAVGGRRWADRWRWTVCSTVVCDGCVIDKAVDISDVYASLPASVNCVSDVVGNSSCPSDSRIADTLQKRSAQASLWSPVCRPALDPPMSFLFRSHVQ
jgi:hypothetical protein